MQPRTATGQPTIRVMNHTPVDEDESLQLTGVHHCSATDAGALGGVHRWVGGSASDLMSMRHPVSRAASRAFWPSRPIAKDN